MIDGKFTLIPAHGEKSEISFSGNSGQILKHLQDSVGGYIEVVWLKNGMILVVNEDGKNMGLPYNESATRIMLENGIQDFIVGDAIFCKSEYLD